MASVFSFIKKELIYLKDSFSEIIKGIILVVFATSGLIFSISLRILGYNGTIITFFGILAEFITLVLCYFFFRKYLKSEEKTERSQLKGKKD
ncbi:MAG: hypothetical protein ACFE9Q_05530 [Candidatus Hodarchaeota archaeon]